MEVENSGWKNTKSSWIENAFEENRSWLGKYKRKIMVWKYEFEKYPALGSLDLDPSPTLIIWGSWNYLRQLKLFEAAEIYLRQLKLFEAAEIDSEGEGKSLAMSLLIIFYQTSLQTWYLSKILHYIRFLGLNFYTA